MKAFAVVGGREREVSRVFERLELPEIAGTRIVVMPPASDGVRYIGAPAAWAGTSAARDELYAAISNALAQISASVTRAGGTVVPAGVEIGNVMVGLEGDLHQLEVFDEVEQEVACNLLRLHSPTLIALLGRGAVREGRAADRTGSRLLAGSSRHLATRYLASTSDIHLSRVAQELRRSDGVSLLDRMDVAPIEHAGARMVWARFVDPSLSVSTLRLHALLLAAVVGKARRMVAEGRRVGNVPQRRLEENRARAVSSGIRAAFAPDEQRPARNGQSSTPKTGARRNEPSEPVPARKAGRELLRDVMQELRSLEATAEELAPLLLMLDLPDVDRSVPVREDELLSRGASDAFAVRAQAMLQDDRPGGAVLESAKGHAPGLTAIILDSYRDLLAGVSTRPKGPTRTADGGGKSQQTGQRGRQGNRRTGKGRRPAGQREDQTPLKTPQKAPQGQGRQPLQPPAQSPTRPTERRNRRVSKPGTDHGNESP